jgi:TnpA family transposase
MAVRKDYKRIQWTDYLLDYIDSKDIREVVQGSLKRGESYYQLSSTIAKVSGGRMLSEKTEIELDINAESIRLIANAVIYYFLHSTPHQLALGKHRLMCKSNGIKGIYFGINCRNFNWIVYIKPECNQA